MLKFVQEEYIKWYGRIYGLDYIIARVANLYGLGQKQNRKQGIIPILIDSLLSDKSITLYGETVRDYIYMDDVMDCFNKIIEYSGDNRIFNVGTGVGTSLSSLIDIVERLCDKEYSDLGIKKDRRSCDVAYSVLDITQTVSELEWSPKVSVEEGISIIANKMRKRDAFF